MTMRRGSGRRDLERQTEPSTSHWTRLITRDSLRQLIKDLILSRMELSTTPMMLDPRPYTLLRYRHLSQSGRRLWPMLPMDLDWKRRRRKGSRKNLQRVDPSSKTSNPYRLTTIHLQRREWVMRFVEGQNVYSELTRPWPTSNLPSQLM